MRNRNALKLARAKSRLKVEGVVVQRRCGCLYISLVVSFSMVGTAFTVLETCKSCPSAIIQSIILILRP